MFPSRRGDESGSVHHLGKRETGPRICLAQPRLAWRNQRGPCSRWNIETERRGAETQRKTRTGEMEDENFCAKRELKDCNASCHNLRHTGERPCNGKCGC